ncbi:hypothetical protein D9757_008241 [Collybiopsis confluens]|uniref:NAD(P)-binding protein n=1 Tax=Collybiopsis confluens TaxID=2823264 RepID=A0A8H5HBE3_9AGAR|nr:hypothetical protein D9757_008241 [Collybiopsis confluens]
MGTRLTAHIRCRNPPLTLTVISRHYPDLHSHSKRSDPMNIPIPTEEETERGFVPISDGQLLEYAERVQGKVVLITGAANGIGRETAMRFASSGAKLVIGDLDVPGAEKAISEIRESGGQAVCMKCDVTIWEEQIALFELAVKTFGCVDVVVANAGVGELSDFTQVKINPATGKPQRPNILAVQVNLIGVMYTLQLAQYFLLVAREDPGSLKAVIALGSVASWVGNPIIPVYVATKHGVLGLVRSLEPAFSAQGIRVAVISPFFAETSIIQNILSPMYRLVLAGIPFTPVSRIAATIVYAATRSDSDIKRGGSSGSAYLLLDDGPVFEVPREGFKMGVYKKLDERANGAFRRLQGLAYTSKVIQDVFGVVGKPIIGSAIAFGIV